MTDLGDGGSVRSDGDSWAITESVGATALAVDRADAAQSLIDHGWQVRAVANADEMARLGRPIPQDLAPVVYCDELLRARIVSGK
jgi:O-methyltransferase involved in polyketide biosynthesis